MSNDIDKVLSEPIMPELSDTERRIKNNLIAFSVVAIFMSYWGLSISDDSSILGLKFKGLDQHKIYIGLVCFIVYCGVHYLWHVHDIFIEWRLRLTAISESRPLRFNGRIENSDLENKRNNTLYHWWNYTKKYAANRESLNESLEASVTVIEKEIDRYKSDRPVDPDFYEAISSMLELTRSSRTEIGELNRMLNSPPFTEALPKFNDAFRYFLKSQNLRWVFFECIIPFGLAMVAIIFIFSKLVSVA